MGYNILIVDDSKTIRAILSKTMRLTGISISEIFEAGNGQEALECLHGQWIDLVLTDLNMPVMTGIELIEAMVADDLLKNVPVVVISTDGSTTRIEELKAKGVREYIQKPFTPEDVRGIIETLLGVLHE
ncbi:MAG: response regulator [candidate division Zixibacteria bacterium]|nr:response regulator [candidate division Zixibacteria bacterium]